MVGLDPEDHERRIIAHAKCNLAPLGPSLSYTIADGQFEWTGEVDVSAEQLCAEPADDEARTALEEAIQFIEGEMTDGNIQAKTIITHAKQMGLLIAL